MPRENKRWLVLAGTPALVAVAVVVIVVARRSPPGGQTPGTAAPNTPGVSARTSFPNNSGGASTGAVATSTASPSAPGTDAGAAADLPPVAKQIEYVMGQWRSGILARDADAVVAADGAFRSEPKKFLEALMTAAETDTDDRVRAFSTRVLGKLVDPTCAPLLTRLLDDKSQYVRMNAAWGLGELANTPEGNAAAKPALRQLRRLEKRETAKDTREAATLAARRLM